MARVAVTSALTLPCAYVTFREWIQALIADRFGTPTALANALDMHLTVFSRGVATGTFSMVNLLKLAKVADEHPSKVLRLAGKSDEADLIEALYGTSEEFISPSQRELLAKWKKLSPTRQKILDDAIEEFIGMPAPSRKKRPA
jgi:hypothetical protein